MVMTVATMQSWAMVYKVVVQTLLIYGRKSWVATDVILKVM